MRRFVLGVAIGFVIAKWAYNLLGLAAMPFEGLLPDDYKRGR